MKVHEGVSGGAMAGVAIIPIPPGIGEITPSQSTSSYFMFMDNWHHHHHHDERERLTGCQSSYQNDDDG